MARITIITLLIMVTIGVSGCTDWKPTVGAPWNRDLLENGPPGPPKWRLGWKDGCQTGISGTSNHFQKHFYKFTQNYELSKDPVYYRAWKIAFSYCQRYIFQYAAREYF